MDYETKVVLFHCLEWLCFWWENQEENDWGESTQDAEGAEEFAGTWWSNEGDDTRCDTVAYSAGVFCEDITDVKIADRFADEAELDRLIAHAKEFFTKESGMSYEDFMPYWW